MVVGLSTIFSKAAIIESNLLANIPPSLIATTSSEALGVTFLPLGVENVLL